MPAIRRGACYFSVFGTAGSAILDWVQWGGSFDVGHSDVFGAERTVASGEGNILAPYSVRSGTTQPT